MKTGTVYGINSQLVLIEGLKYYIGDLKTDGIEKGDTVEFENLDNMWLTHLTLVAKAGAAPAAAVKATKPAPAATKKAQPATKTGGSAPVCKFKPCPDGKEHFILEKRRNRWECECIGQDLPNLSKCPLEYRKDEKILPDAELDAKAKAAGFGTPTVPPTVPDEIQQASGTYLGMGKDKIMLKIDGKNQVYNADPELVKYLSRKDCKAVPDMVVTLELKDRHDGKGFLATQIGPGPEEKKTSPPADPPAGPQAAAPLTTTHNKQPATPPATAKPLAKPATTGSAPSFHKAARKSAKLRVGLCGTAGCGKSFGALLMAMGIEGPIAVIDTENSSAELYAHLGDYDVCVLQAPFTPQKYTDAIHAAERAGYNIIILDSITHAWAGEGGLLDIKDNIARNSKSGNSFTAWKDVTPLHRGLVEAMLQSPCHIIATMRSKTEYVIDVDDRGRSFPRKIGMAPVQREGMDYEFTLVFDIDAAHIATASKDRTSLFTGKSFQISIETGRQLKEWLNMESPAGGA